MWLAVGNWLTTAAGVVISAKLSSGNSGPDGPTWYSEVSVVGFVMIIQAVSYWVWVQEAVGGEP